MLAIIPARAGSKGLADKNIVPLHGHPLIAWTIAAATRSMLFERIVVSTNSDVTANISRSYGA